MTEKIILGNVITMDGNLPKAEAVAVKDGKIVCVGSKEEARAAVSKDAEVLDYSGYYVYPGFLEPHTHGTLAGSRAIGQADLSMVFPTDYEEYKKIIIKFIEDNPGKDYYLAAGWVEDGTPLDYRYLDDICADYPLIMNSAGGHACLLNTKAMEKYGFNDESVKKFGVDLVHVGEDGHPNGYLCEAPCINLIGGLPNEVADVKKYILKWQEMALSKGFTAVADAGVELLSKNSAQAYKELEAEGKLVMRTYGYLLVKDNPENPEAEVERIADEKAKISGEYFKVVGVKAFLDGVIEAHTGWLLEDYDDQAGYHGFERYNDEDKMVRLLVAASKKGLPVHVHSEGDGATKYMLNCIAKAQEISKDYDQRNMLAHLHLVADEDIKKMASTHSIAAVAPLWTPFFPGEGEQEVAYVGQHRSDVSYPIKSFVDEGATIVYHSDYPISPYMDISRSVYMAETRGCPDANLGGPVKTARNTKEAVDRKASLEALTKNVAYAWHEEDRMGSIENGKLANFAVVDFDFLEGEIDKVPDGKIIATIVDGNVVYSGK